MAIMGFGGGAMIGAPLANLLMTYFRTRASVGVWETFLVLAAIYFVFMMSGAFAYLVCPTPRVARRRPRRKRRFITATPCRSLPPGSPA
jgi:hypothetical protein